MTLTLPPLLAAMIAAHNLHDAEAFVACFAEDAVVRDEGRRHVGRDAIRSWFEEVSRRYAPVFQVTNLAVQDGEPVLSGTVAGNFEGSPIALRYFASLEDGKVVALRIAP